LTRTVTSSTSVSISATAAGVTKTAALTVTPCTVPIVSPPSLPATDTIWFDDAPPPGATTSGTWNWDTSQRASGAQSHTEPWQGAAHQHNFTVPWEQGLYLNATDRLVAYVLINPCDPPREIMLQLLAPAKNGWDNRAYWGEDLMDTSAPRINLGSLPVAGQWGQLEGAASSLPLWGEEDKGISFPLHWGPGCV